MRMVTIQTRSGDKLIGFSPVHCLRHTSSHLFQSSKIIPLCIRHVLPSLFAPINGLTLIALTEIETSSPRIIYG